MNPSERIAKSVIETLIGGSRMCYRQDQTAGAHDFDLQYADGTVAAVEVTASVKEGLERTVAAILDNRKGQTPIHAKKSRNGWYIYPRPMANIKKIRTHVDEYLAAVEAEGITRFFAYRDASESPSVSRILRDLGIEAGEVIKWKTPNCIRVGLPVVGGLVCAEHVNQAIEAEAKKPDNRRKLANSGCDDRHLFVYIERRNFVPWVALVDEHPPTQGPSLPPEINHVWATTHTRSADKIVVWRAENGKSWQHLGLLGAASPTQEAGF